MAPDLQDKKNAAVAKLPSEHVPFHLGRAIAIMLCLILFPLSVPVVLALYGWPALSVLFGSTHCSPLQVIISMVAPCVAVILLVFHFDESSGSGISSTELSLGLGYFLASCMLAAARHGFTSDAVFEQQLQGPTAISHALNDRMSLKDSWLHPPIEVLRQEAHMASRRLGIELSAQWFIARQSMLPAILAMLEPSISHANALRGNSSSLPALPNFVADNSGSGFLSDEWMAHEAGSAADIIRKSSSQGKLLDVDTTNPMVEGPSHHPLSGVVLGSDLRSGRNSPLHPVTSVDGVYNMLGKEAVFSLEAMVVSAAARSQPGNVQLASRLAALVAMVSASLHYVAFFSQGKVLEMGVIVSISRVTLFLLCSLMHWNVLEYLVVAVVDYRRRRLMSSTLTAVLQGPCFGTPAAQQATQNAIDQAVESAVQSGAVRDILSTSGLPAFNPFNVGAAPPRPSQARASLAQQATDHLLSLPVEKRMAIKAEIRPVVYPSLPLVDLSRPENAVAWIRARSLVSDFGSVFFLRIQLVVTILGILTLWLVIATVSSMTSFGVAIGDGLGGDSLYVACVVNIVAMAAALVTCMANGAYCNNDLSWQADQLSKTAISTSQLAHSLRVLHRIGADGKAPQVAAAPPSARGGTFNRSANAQSKGSTLAHMEGTQDRNGLSAQMLLAQGSAVHLWREAFASTLLARISRIVAASAEGRALLVQMGVKGLAQADAVDMVLQQETTVRLSQTAVLRLLSALPLPAVRLLQADLEHSQNSLVAVRDALSLYVRTHRLCIIGLPATDTSAGYTLGALACAGSIFVHAMLVP